MSSRVQLKVWPSEDRSAPRAELSPLQRTALGHLRVAGLACRTRGRSELFRACALLQVEGTRHTAAFADALVCGLPEALGKRPVFFAPGEDEVWFDEAWLLRAIDAHTTGDTDSLAFLIPSRVQPGVRRQIGFLITGLADACRADPSPDI